MDRLLLSSLVGLVTYMVLKVSPLDNEPKGQSGGAKKKEKDTEQYPECFEICGLAKKVFNQLKKNGLDNTDEFKNINRLYSKIFCLEIALGNNPDKKVDKNKVESELNKYKGYFNLNDEDNVKKYINDVFNKTEKLLKNITKDDDLIKLNKQIKEIHDEEIMKLLKKFLEK